MAYANSIVTGDKSLTVANAGNNEDVAYTAEVDLRVMSAKQLVRACMALEVAE